MDTQKCDFILTPALSGVAGLVSNVEVIDKMLSAIESEAGEDSAVLVDAIRKTFDEYTEVFLKTAEVIDFNPLHFNQRVD